MDDTLAMSPAAAVRESLSEVENFMAEIVQEHADVLAPMVKGHFAAGGKRVRARFALEAMSCLCGAPERGIFWAAACELLHNATLIHDDIQDQDVERRGSPTVWARYGVAQAINVGDLLLMLPQQSVARSTCSAEVKWQLAQQLTHAALRVVRGQAREFEWLSFARPERSGGANSLLHQKTRSLYELAAREKTASLFELPVVGAALIAGHPLAQAQRLGEAFAPLGFVFQIVDDLLDYYGRKGKARPGEDIREGKVTCLVALHFEHFPEDRHWISQILSKPRFATATAEVQQVLNRFAKKNTAALALEWIASLQRQLAADEILLSLPSLRQSGLQLLASMSELISDPQDSASSLDRQAYEINSSVDTLGGQL